MWSEDGLADRTLEAYRRDLDALAAWLAGRGRNLRGARREDISAYHGRQSWPCARWRGGSRRSAATTPSWSRNEPDFADPTLLIERPKLPRSLPKALAEREIEGLLLRPIWAPRWACATAPCWS